MTTFKVRKTKRGEWEIHWRNHFNNNGTLYAKTWMEAWWEGLKMWIR